MSQSIPGDNPPANVDAGAAPAPKKATNSKFKVLAVLVVAFLGLIGSAAYAYWSRINDEKTTERIKEELAAQGIDMIYSQGEAQETSIPIFQSFAPTLNVRIQPNKGKLNDDGLKVVLGINQDLSLVLNDCPVTNDGLALLEGKRNIRWLQLRRTKIDDDGIKHLKGMNLEDLDLSSTKITNAGLASLCQLELPRLRTLSLEGTTVTDEGISHLDHFKNLEFMAVAHTKVTKDGIRKLKAKLPELTILSGT